MASYGITNQVPFNSKELFERATAKIPASILAQIDNLNLLGIWRRKDGRKAGEVVFEVDNAFYKVETSLYSNIKNYETVLFKKHVIEDRTSYRIAGADEFQHFFFYQILNWRDFKESGNGSLFDTLLTGYTKLTLKNRQLIVHSFNPSEIFIVDDEKGMVAKGFSCAKSVTVTINCERLDFVS